MKIYFLPAMQAYVTTDYCHNPGGWYEVIIELIDNGQLVMRLVDDVGYITEETKFLQASLLSPVEEHKEAVEAFLQIISGYSPNLSGDIWVDTRDVRDWEDFVSDEE